MRCCPDCFGDQVLKAQIFQTLEVTQGDCSYCLQRGIITTDPKQLFDLFSQLLGIYAPDEVSGKPLYEILKSDWLLFEGLDTHAARSLVGDILDDSNISRQKFSPHTRFASRQLSDWEDLRSELKHKNRYFPKTSIDLGKLGDLLDQLIAVDLPTVWYRARLQQDGRAIAPQSMGAPPKHLATHGRANPPGIPYLYLGSTVETAASEIRPHTGDTATIAEFLIEGIKAADLRHPRRRLSPFEIGDEESIGSLRSDIPFLEQLGDELTRPVRQQIAPIDYVPSQYLCEFIKNRGFDGVVYRSSVGDGINLALFSPEKYIPSAVSTYRIDRVKVDVRSLNPTG